MEFTSFDSETSYNGAETLGPSPSGIYTLKSAKSLCVPPDNISLHLTLAKGYTTQGITLDASPSQVQQALYAWLDVVLPRETPVTNE